MYFPLTFLDYNSIWCQPFHALFKVSKKKKRKMEHKRWKNWRSIIVLHISTLLYNDEKYFQTVTIKQSECCLNFSNEKHVCISMPLSKVGK